MLCIKRTKRGGIIAINIDKFSKYTMMEERITNRSHTIAMRYPPFKVELKNLEFFSDKTCIISQANYPFRK